MNDSVDYLPRAEGHVSPFGRAVEAMHLTASAADEQLFAEINGWYAIRVRVLDGYAERTPDAVLATEITRLARRLFAARTREYYRLQEIHLQPNPIALRRTRDKHEQALEDRPAAGAAAAGQVEVSTIGMRHFHVELTPGIAASLGSGGLSAALTTAANNMVDEWRTVLAEYKRELWSK